MMFMTMTLRCQEKIALCSVRLLERTGEVGSCSPPKLLCAARSSTKYGIWSLVYTSQVSSPTSTRAGWLVTVWLPGFGHQMSLQIPFFSPTQLPLGSLSS